MRTLHLAASLLLLSVAPVVAQTRSLQGDTNAWTRHPAMHRMWEQLRTACRDGCAKADPATFEREALDTVQEMGPDVGLTREGMREHVKAIPRQLLKIGVEDPAILTDYDRFLVALVGPSD